MASDTTRPVGASAAVRPLRDSSPREVGQYRMLAELGRGGMGRVLLGSGPDGRLAAVKLVHEQFAEDPGFRARFRREVEASQAVSGAYTAAVIDADPDAPTPWLASVFVPGPSLHEAITRTGTLPEQPALRLAAGLATALIHIHRADLVHRDLKPSNVLLTDDGLRVIDFGIVRAISSDQAGELTRTGWLIGSPAFMSPEQASSAEVTPASDVFSLATVITAACTGDSPFSDTATLQTLNNVVRAEPDLSGVPTAIRQIVEPCLDKDPCNRPTPAELLESIGQLTPSAQPWPTEVHQLIAQRQADVAEFLDRSPETIVVTDAVPPTGTRLDTGSTSQPAAPARSRRLRAGAAIVASALVAGVAWTLWPSPQAPPPEVPPTPAPRIQQIGSMTSTTAAAFLEFSPDGRLLAVAHDDNTVQLRDVATQQLVGQILSPIADFSDLSFSPDSRGLVVTGFETVEIDGSVEGQWVTQQWDVASGRQVGEPLVVKPDPDGSTYDIGSPVLSDDGRTLAVTNSPYGADDYVQLWDVVERRQTSHLNTSSADRFGPDGRTLVTGGLELWDVAGQHRIGNPISLPEEESESGVAFSSDGALLMTASTQSTGSGSEKEYTGMVRLWDPSTQNQIRQPIVLPDRDLNHATISPDGRLIATTSELGLELWSTETGQQIGTAIAGARRVAFSPDGRTLATGGEDNAVRLWRVPTD